MDRMKTLNLRLPPESNDRAESLIPHLQGVQPELGTVTRADVFRVALLRGLALMERERGKAGK